MTREEIRVSPLTSAYEAQFHNILAINPEDVEICDFFAGGRAIYQEACLHLRCFFVFEMFTPALAPCLLPLLAEANKVSKRWGLVLSLAGALLWLRDFYELLLNKLHDLNTVPETQRNPKSPQTPV